MQVPKNKWQQLCSQTIEKYKKTDYTPDWSQVSEATQTAENIPSTATICSEF
jgi:hypothetical protein